MKWIGATAILLLAFLGLTDAVYLAQHAASGTPLICNIEGLSGCNSVAASPYARFFGVPLAEFGVFFYSVLFILAALELVLVDRLLRRALQVTALIGLIASLYFTFLQAFIISAFCIYCLMSAAITLCVFIAASFLEPVRLKRKEVPPQGVASTLPMPPRA